MLTITGRRFSVRHRYSGRTGEKQRRYALLYIMALDQKWLQQYESELRNKIVLEVGCGLGEDTKELLEMTKSITSLDIDEERVRKLKYEMPHLNIHCMDIRSGLDFPSNSFDVILASLSLHYFTVIETQTILTELKRVLKINSIMIVRVNSENDKNYGSIGYTEIERNLFNVEGQAKRFFNREDIFSIFGNGWDICKLVEKTIDRFHRPKVVWEFIAKSV